MIVQCTVKICARNYEARIIARHDAPRGRVIRAGKDT
jgi:hypothetical protein